MKYRIHHRTAYVYAGGVTLCHNILHLKPRKTPRQTCLSAKLSITPEPAVVREYPDYFGNLITYFCIEERHESLDILAQSEVEVAAFTPPLVEFTPPWEDVRDTLNYNAPAHLDAIQYKVPSDHVILDETVAAYALQSFTPRRPILAAAQDLTTRIHRDFKYDTTATSINTAPQEVMRIRKGVCQDFAHLQIACFRAIGLAARYVSGYLQTRPAGDPQKLVGADASHAWVAFYCPEFGWIDLDPTNNLVPSERHVTVSWGRDYADVSPVKGVIIGGGRHTISVGVDVAAI